MSLASIGAILSTGLAVMDVARRLYDAGKDIAPQLADLKKVFSGDKITVEELADIRARNDALNAEIEGQTESGS